MTILLQHYHQALRQNNFQPDEGQQQALSYLQRIYDELAVATPSVVITQSSLFTRLFHSTKPVARQPIRGLYLWGGVGRGKTFLVDLFFAALPLPRKQRLHFHRFMYQVHQELTALKDQQDPLKIVAKRFAQQAQLICLDEFFIADITDAMVMYQLLHALVAQGVTLVITSNSPPDELYKNGLQRARFLPAIALIKQHLEVFNLDSGVDYRLRYLEKAEIYHSPLDAQADAILHELFLHIAPEAGQTNAPLDIQGRIITTRRLADGIVWFDFTAICDGPRSQTDYIEIARYFHTVVISNIPILTTLMEDQARRFLHLVDEFYDRHVKLIISAAAPIEQLYQGKKLTFEYQRAISRLQEMQSRAYLARPHLS